MWKAESGLCHYECNFSTEITANYRLWEYMVSDVSFRKLNPKICNRSSDWATVRRWALSLLFPLFQIGGDCADVPWASSSFPLRDVVLKLLQFEASTNVADSKGCFPLHLAAWKGDVEIVRILIRHGPSHCRVNEQVGGLRETHPAS